MSRKGSKAKRHANRPVIEEIEPRILYSADFAPGLVDAVVPVPAAEQRVVEPSGEFTHTSIEATQTRRHEIVFIDTATPDYQRLVADIHGQGSERDVEVVLLDPTQDGIGQITRTLSGRTDIDAVHIVSHGADGAVQLGNSSLEFDSLLKSAAKIKGWGEALTDQADILIYGCDVAASAQGRSLVDALARLTGAAVAASDDPTGHADLGGDWDLEFHAGEIETSIAFSQSVVLDWRATLPATAAGGETLVNSTTGGTQQIAGAPTRAIAMDASGNYVVVWSGNGTGDASGVFAQRYDANGVAQGGEIQVNGSTANAQTAPSVAMDASGNFVVAWTTDHTSAGNDEVYARRFAANGTPLAGEFQVNSFTAGSQSSPVVGTNASGAFVVAWESNGQDGGGAGVYAQRYNASGAAQGSEFRVNVTTAGDQSVDSVALDAAGNFVVTFASADADMNGVFMRRYNAAGTALTAGDVRVNTTTTNEQSWSSLAMDPNGNFVVVWRSVNQDGSSGGIYGQRFNPSGVAQGVEFQINTTTANDQANPSAAMDLNGNFVVAWASSGQDGSGWGIYKREYDADGTANGGEVRVNTTTTNSQVNPWVAMNPDRDFVVAWGGEGAGDTAGVFAQRYSFGLVVDTVSDTADGNTTSISALLANKGADGRISLREAILAANATANVGGADVIRFDIAGAGPHTISLSAILPDITDSVLIDGWSEPDFAGTPVMVLDGTNTATRGLRVQDASGSTIRGLVLHRFTDDAIGVQGAGAVGNVIVGNYLGTDVTGMIAMGNGGDGIDVRNGATNTVIGGTTAALRNVISGNTGEGVQIATAGTNGTLIQGNYIGLDAAGSAALPNASFGVVIGTNVTSATIGGTAVGAGNVISGNILANIRIANNATGVTVQGNIVGLNAAGTAAVINGAEGIAIATGSNTIGGSVAGARNVISGNAGTGIVLESGAGATIVQGNYIGTNAAGTAAVGNAGDGISMQNAGNTIGGAVAAARNVVAGNAGDGIELLLGGAVNSTIQGNYVGVNAAGTAVLGNQQHGILINVGPDGNTVSGNVIGGNALGGIRIIGAGGDNTTNNLIRGNWIGTDPTGTLDFGNLLEGVALQNGAAGNQIGGAAAGQGNVIAFNDTAGVAVYSGSVGNPILRNAIYSNGALGIELDNVFGTGVTPNDAGDADTGSNSLQNFPVLLYAQSNAGFTTVTGTLNSTASSTFTIHFYSSPTGDEGAVYLGSTSVTTDASGNAVINAGLAVSVTAGHVITATATSAGNDTSEFSAAVSVAAGGLLVVDTSSDVIDGTTTSLAALYASKGADGRISLREALAAANNTANANASTPDRIYFNILGGGVHVITLGSLLPNVNEAVVLDGSTDPNFAGTPVIEVRGGGTVANAFNVAAGGAGSTIRGFVINGFSTDSIVLTGGNNLIAGNYVGTNAAGSAVAAIANADGGIRILTGSDNNVIGGTSALDRNIFSGNGGGQAQDNEISLHGGNNLIIGNYVGVAADGITVIGNLNDGIDISTGATNNIIGGLNAGEGNLIAGHTGGGVRIQNNAIGTHIRGNTVWANGSGVAISGASTGHLIQENSIYGNTGLGIDLGANGLTANDGAKTAGQPNLLMDFPVIQTVTISGTTLTLSGYIGIAPGDTDFAGARVEFFRSPDPTGANGEGQTYLGFLTADASGNFSGALTVSGLVAGDRVTAAATDGADNTSEFGVNVTVVAGNGAPVLADTVVTLNSVNEDAGVPAGAVGTLISALVGGVTDADSGAVKGIAVTAADAANGIWWYSINNGASWNALGVPSPASSRLLASDAGTRIYFQPSANFNGTLATALTFRAWDQTSGSNGATANTTSNGGTTAFSSATDTASLTVNAVNDAPSITNAASVSLTGTNEDTTSSGTTVNTILTGAGWADVDSGALKGIAVAAVTGNGTWQYSTDGITWTNFGSVSGTSALLLDSASQVRYVPDGQNGETPTFSFRAWDQTTGSASVNGSPSAANPGAGGGTSAYSTESASTSIVVSAINDAPTITNAASVSLTGTNEDTTSSGTTVNTILTGAGWADVDTGALKGIAVTAVASSGTWQYSTDGITWTSFGSVSGTSALLLDSASQVRYVPNGQNGETATFSFRAWDKTTGSASINGSPSTANPGAGGGTSAYSSQSASTSIVVTSLNDAPVLDNSGAMSLTGITEDDTGNAGDLVSAIIASAGGDRITDVDSGAIEGIAVTALVSGNGTWQYSTDGGGSWNAVGAVSNNSALLLRAVDRLRFVPDGLNADTPSLSFRAWDQTSGTQGTKVDVSTNGGSTAFSSAIETASLTVAAVNDAPVLADTVVTLNSVNEDAGVPSGAVGTLISALVGGVNDVDSGALKGIAVTAADAVNGTWWYSTSNGASWNALGSPSAASSILLAADASTRLYFQPNTDYNGTLATAITFRAWDRSSGTNGGTADTTGNGGTTAFSSATDTASLSVNPVNDAPTGLPTISGTPTEDQALTADTSAINDVDGLGAFGYQWLRNGVAIGGATAGAYTLGDADVGTQIGVRVSYTDGFGTAESVTSAQTAAVANINDAPTGIPTISGTPTEDQTLTANTAGIADADGLGAFGYQWLRNGVAIGGATSGAYTLGDADVGTQISVQVSYTDAHGTSEGPLTSAQTAPVANVNDAPVGLPIISGTVTEDQTLTANAAAISDADGLGPFSYQWLRNGVAVGGATASTYTLDDADVGTQISVRVSYTDGYGTAESVTSAQTAAVGNVNDVPTGVPTISGTLTEDQTLTANTGGIADADGLGAIGYQWLRNGVAIGGATSGTYTLGDADVGAQISVQVSYTDAHGTGEGPLTSAQTAPVANVNDVPTGVPTITGTVTEDQVLTANTAGIADADGLGAFSYQWLRDGVAIGGAIANTYTLGDADVGTQISVQVSYTDAHGTSEGPLTSAQTAPVANVNDAPTGVPTISGTVTEDQTLTANTGGIADIDGLGAFSYQWLRNGVAIGGATSNTYTLGDADVGTQISVQVSYADGHGTAESLTSAQTAAVANVNDAPAGIPTISGTVTEDQTLTANTAGIADADGLGAFSYQWLRNGVAIGGATSGTYTLGDADVGTQISVQVSYTDGHGTSEGPLTSAQTGPVANVNDAPTGMPTITGAVTEDQTLTANTGGIGDADGLGVFGYQWLRNGVAIGGATASTYALGDADVGTQISVQVGYTDGQGTAESVSSAQTTPVTNINDAPVGIPAISGTPTENQALTANTGGISDADGLGAFSYQWLRNGVAIGGATAGTYILGAADVGTQISVAVSYTDAQGTSEGPLTSAQTAPVANVNDPPVGAPTISGTVTEDQTLTANTAGISDADGLGAFSYQWLRNGVVIAGATAGTYTLGDADVATQISVQVSYTDGQGTAESVISAQTAPVANVNDAPVLLANTLTLGQGQRVIVSAADLSATDVDDVLGSLVFTVSSVTNGHFELVSAPNVAISGFTQAQVSGGVVVFVHDGSRVAPAYAVTVSDTGLSDGPRSAGVTFVPSVVLPPVSVPVPLPVNEPPQAEAAIPSTPERPAATTTVVRPALYSPGRIDPPDTQLNEFTVQPLARQRLIQPVATLNHFTPGPYIDPSLQFLAAAPANLQYLPTTPVDWHVRSAFPDAEETPRDRIDVLLEQVQLGGMALSVGVVWWASRVSGLLGSLLASAPAWRHIDPLPVVGRDEDEDKKWYDTDDRDADANELAIANVLEGAAEASDRKQA